jgi:hypothetical protein
MQSSASCTNCIRAGAFYLTIHLVIYDKHSINGATQPKTKYGDLTTSARDLRDGLSEKRLKRNTT